VKKTAQEYFTHCRNPKDGDYVGVEHGHIVRIRGTTFGICNRGTRRYPNWRVTDILTGYGIYDSELMASVGKMPDIKKVLRSKEFQKRWANIKDSSNYADCIKSFAAMLNEKGQIK
jgi:hypothetical protein